MRLVGITEQTAMRYCGAAHPERTSKLPKWAALRTSRRTEVPEQLGHVHAQGIAEAGPASCFRCRKATGASCLICRAVS
jgi:hypothetical protein